MTLDLATARQIADAYTAAWNSGDPAQVVSFFAPEGGIVINRGDPWEGRSGVRDMDAGFYADVPDLALVCDDLRLSGSHVLYLWTFTGHDAGSGHPLKIHGWEEWDLDPENHLVTASRGWFDAEDYARQASGG